MGWSPNLAYSLPMTHRTHPRDPGTTPNRQEVVRYRVEDGDGGDSSDEEAKEEAKEKKWHDDKAMPFVRIGEVFEIDGWQFERKGPRSCDCLNCEKEFRVHSYHKRALTDHATRCKADHEARLARSQQSAAATQEWTGTVECTHTMSGENVTVVFEKMSFCGCKKGLRCTSTSAPLLRARRSSSRTRPSSRASPTRRTRPNPAR